MRGGERTSDAEEPGTVINEFLVTLFLPGIFLFVALWASFRLVFDEFLRYLGLELIVPATGPRAVALGLGRLLLLVVLTAVLLVPYLGRYVRVLRASLRERARARLVAPTVPQPTALARGPDSSENRYMFERGGEIW